MILHILVQGIICQLGYCKGGNISFLDEIGMYIYSRRGIIGKSNPVGVNDRHIFTIKYQLPVFFLPSELYIYLYFVSIADGKYLSLVGIAV